MQAINQAEEFRLECENYQIDLEKYEETLKTNKKLAKAMEKPTKPKPDYAFEGRNIFQHVLHHLKSIRRSELENSLKFVNFTAVKKMMLYIEYFIRNEVEIELVTKVLIYFIRGYQTQITGCEEMKLLMTSIYYHLSRALKHFKEKIGINISAIKLLQYLLMLCLIIFYC